MRTAVDDDAVAISVRDHGVGLRPGEAALVFNRFWRADPSRARTVGGTGLGLSIAIEDARLHHGWLQAWGEPGQGSCFRLTLPRTAGGELTSSPLPLAPEEDERRRSSWARPTSGCPAPPVTVRRRALGRAPHDAADAATGWPRWPLAVVCWR